MRMPSFETDGWRLNDGEQLHREAPAIFGFRISKSEKFSNPVISSN
jgi:hypothetical protein